MNQRTIRQSFFASALCLALPIVSLANITNIATATFNDVNGTPQPAVQSNQVTVTVTTPPPVITLTKNVNTTTAQSGTTLTFTIAYANTSSGAATNVAITDVVPTGSTLVPSSISNGGSLSGNTITWNVGTVAGGGSGSVSFQVTVQ